MITTARLLLRPFTLDDAVKLLAMSSEAGMRRFIPDQVYRDRAHAEEVVRVLMVLADPRRGPHVLGIEHAGELIGHVGLSPARGSVEIGYAVEDRVQGKGFATEAVDAAAAWALAQLGLPEVLGIVDAENLGSIRVLEKAGFARVGADGTRLIYRRTATGA